jgi:hypothetical protein
MPYCEETDLLLGDDILMPSSLSKPKFVAMAASDMDAKLGYVYVVPIVTTSMPVHQKNLLKSINAKLASGRLIMAQAMASQDSAVHQYALYLIKEAEMDLMTIANGTVDLTAPLVDDAGSPINPVENPLVDDPWAKTPTGWNPDATSPVTAFEKTFMGEDPLAFYPWEPSSNIVHDGGRVQPR